MDPAAPFLQVVGQFVVLVADDLLPARGEIDLVADAVPVPDPVVAAGDGQRQALLGLAQFRDVGDHAHDAGGEVVLVGENGLVDDHLPEAAMGLHAVLVALHALAPQQFPVLELVEGPLMAGEELVHGAASDIGFIQAVKIGEGLVASEIAAKAVLVEHGRGHGPQQGLGELQLALEGGFRPSARRHVQGQQEAQCGAGQARQAVGPDQGVVLLVKGRDVVQDERVAGDAGDRHLEAVQGLAVQDGKVGALLHDGDGVGGLAAQDAQGDARRGAALGSRGNGHASQRPVAHPEIPGREERHGRGEAQPRRGLGHRQQAGALEGAAHGQDAPFRGEPGQAPFQGRDIRVRGKMALGLKGGGAQLRLQEGQVQSARGGVLAEDENFFEPRPQRRGQLQGPVEGRAFGHPGDAGVAAKHGPGKIVHPAEHDGGPRRDGMAVAQDRFQGVVVRNQDEAVVRVVVNVGQVAHEGGFDGLPADDRSQAGHVEIVDVQIDGCVAFVEDAADLALHSVRPFQALVVGVQDEDSGRGALLRRDRVGQEKSGQDSQEHAAHLQVCARNAGGLDFHAHTLTHARLGSLPSRPGQVPPATALSMAATRVLTLRGLAM